MGFNHQTPLEGLDLCIFVRENDPSATEYFIFCHPHQVKEWKKDKSIPTTSVVERFDIFSTESGGHTGKAIRPSRQSLFNTFDTDNTNEIISIILDKGHVIPSHKYNFCRDAGFKY